MNLCRQIRVDSAGGRVLFFKQGYKNLNSATRWRTRHYLTGRRGITVEICPGVFLRVPSRAVPGAAGPLLESRGLPAPIGADQYG